MSQRFPATLFTRLGGRFFRTLIRCAVEHGTADFVVATNHRENRVDGFAVLVHTKTWISETVRRYPAAFTLAAGAAMVRPAVWLRLASRFRSRISRRPAAVDGHEVVLPELPDHELYMVAVRPESEGRGCGRALIRGVEQSVRSAGSTRYKVFTAVSNRRANRFYRNNGLSHVGQVEPSDVDMNVYIKDV